MKSIDQITSLIRSEQDSLEQRFSHFSTVIKSNAGIAAEFVTKKQSPDEAGFNIFQIISNKFFYENFHSDLIASLLDPSGLHGEGNKFLQLFITYLNQHFHIGLSIDDYRDSVVRREKPGKIDISICNPLSKKAIIIENKINNAPDMKRQLPRYFETIAQAGYIPEAIVYLTLDSSKKPDKANWTLGDRRNVDPLLHFAAAYTNNAKDLYNGWLLECQKESTRLDSVTVLRQYTQLIKNLGVDQMDKPFMEKLFNRLSENENDYRTAQSLNLMMQNFPDYLAQRIQDKYNYRSNPFDSVWIFKGNTTVFGDWHYKDSKFAVDVLCSTDSYTIKIFDRNQIDENLEKIVELINGEDHFSFSSLERRYVMVQEIKILDQAEKDLFTQIDYMLGKFKQFDKNEVDET